MIKSYFKTAVRNYSRNRGFTLINIGGLSVGMTSALILILFVVNELSFDRFHNKADRIYRVEEQHGPDPANRGFFTSPPLAPALKSMFPEILDVTRIMLWKRNVLVSYKDKKFVESNIARADSSLFDVFTIPFLEGNPKEALRRPNTVVITDKIAKKFFGDEDPLGKSININSKTAYEITGVVHELPQNSHFFFDFLIPANYEGLNWGDGCLQTYLTLPENYDKAQLEQKFPDFILRYMSPWLEKEYGLPVTRIFKDKNNQINYFLAPLRNVYLHHNMEGLPGLDGLMMKFGSLKTVILFSILAVFVLLIACINFINLSIGRSVKRTSEISLRKVMGARKSSLIRQFLIESVMISSAALILAFIILRISIPFFNNYLNTSIGFSNISLLFPVFVIITFLVGILSGLYPAFYLSSINPAEILGKKSGPPLLRTCLNHLLLTVQFIISIGLIISTATIFLQLNFVNKVKLGFTKDHVMLIERAGALGENQHSFTESLKRNPGVLETSYSNSVPGRHFEPTGYNLEGAPRSESFFLMTMNADQDFLKTLDLKLVRGRYFSKGTASGNLEAVINEKAVERYRWKEPLGKRIIYETKENGENVYAEIIGVVRDFNFEPLYQVIQPMMICNLPYPGNLLVVKLRPENLNNTIVYIQNQWSRMTNAQPFQYCFLDDDFGKSYKPDQRRGILFLLFSILAIFLSCMGMLGLVISSTEQRTKEIGIRKVNGATSMILLTLFSKNYLRWIGIAFLVACPVSYYAMYRYLENFAFRINLSLWIFVFAGLFTMLITILTITWQNWLMASKNPVEMLRYE
ncbi:MAG: ABC transporter permease [Bacteroidota bacterium]